MVVDEVGYRTSVADLDVRRDEATAEATRDQVPVAHAGPTGDPVVVVGGCDDQLRYQLGYRQLGAGRLDVAVANDAYGQITPRQGGHRGIIGGTNHLEAETELVGQCRDRVVERGTRRDDLGHG